MELIDRDALMEFLQMIPIDLGDREVNQIRTYVMRGMPTVDAEPVRHGQWIHGQEECREYIGITLVLVQYKHWECSACGYRTDNEPIWKYCPNCGARMGDNRE